MRTLNKTLALVLALVMVLGMFGVATAADFTDDETIQYKEAVGVMTGIEAINGMGDGTFAPAGNVTRAQAAKMVAYAVLGKGMAEKLPVVASSFKDVDANFAWAIPSIEYLVGEGVINGRGDGTFDPAGDVTAYEIAKMLLCAAGYGVNDEYVGNSWAITVAIDAQKNGVFADTKATELNAAASREECALYCFNVLTGVEMVRYGEVVKRYVGLGTDLGWEVYGLDYDSDEDAFMRPSKVWTSFGEVIATLPAPAVAVYNDASYAKDFAADTYDFADDLVIYNNGGVMEGLDATTLATRKLNGTGIELYNTDTDKEIELIVMTQGYLATVTDYTATKGTAYGNFDLAIYNPWATPATGTKTVTDTTETDDLFDKLLAAGLAKDDYLIVYTVGAALEGAIMKFAPATSVTGALSAYTVDSTVSGFNGNVTVGGTKYTLASACVEETPFISTDLSNYVTKNVVLFIDEYGMVIGIIEEDEAPVESGLMFVPQAFTTDNAVTVTGADGKPVAAYKNIAFIDGAPKLDVLVTDVTGLAEGFYTYEVEDGIYTLATTATGVGMGEVNEAYADGRLDITTAKGTTVLPAKDAFITDVIYLAAMLEGAADDMTQITTLAGLKGETIAFIIEDGDITGIYVVPTYSK